MKGIVKLGVTLFMICFVAAGSLAFVASFTAEPIAEQARREQQEALKMVAPKATDFPPAGQDRWDAVAAGTRIGEVRAGHAKGYSGPVDFVVGMDLEGRITGVRVTKQSETPGLGTKVADPPFLSQFPGKNAANLVLKKDDPVSGTVDAVAAATISSRALVKALRDAVSGK